MSRRPYMQFYVSDYIGDTMHLTTEQHGAYLLLLMSAWNAGGVLPNDDRKLATMTRLSLKRWKAMRSDIEPFFTVCDVSWTHARVVEDVQKVNSQSQLRASAGAKGGKAKSLKNNNSTVANATVLPKHSHISEPDITTPDGVVGALAPLTPPENQLAKIEPQTPFAALRVVLDETRARAVVDHRQRLRKPLTVRAAQLLGDKFTQSPDPNASADCMIENGWTGFNVSWEQNRKTNGNRFNGTAKNSNSDSFTSQFNDELDRLAAEYG